MSRFCRASAAAGLWALGLFVFSAPHSVRAQFGTPPLELSGSASLAEADGAVRAHLERVKAYVADRQWDEAVETLRQVMESQGSKLVPLSRGRYVNLTDYCHLQIA